MKKTLNLLIILSLLKIFIFSPNCIEKENFCSICNPITKLCAKCNLNILIPDEKGGCKNAKKCIPGNNYCSQCSEDGELCKTCEEKYFPDENGGCSYTDDCSISYKGDCLKCKEEFILVGQNIKICKSLFSEEFKNCEQINNISGKCEKCKDNYFLNSGDQKFIPTDNCYESSFNICKICNNGYYLDKIENKCKKQDNETLEFCSETIDGKNCDKCEEDYFFDEEGKCIGTKYCSKKITYNKCEKCIDGYYLTKYGNACTKEKNCYEGNKYLGICTRCVDNYYIDFNDGKCKSNQEDNNFKYCQMADNNLCSYCSYGYALGEDFKCASTKNCAESDDGKCLHCIDGYYLGKDNRCTNVERCIYSNFYEECIECEDTYYYDRNSNKCRVAQGDLANCKYNYIYAGQKCEKCKKDFYLNKTDNICYSNKEKGEFYKCETTDYYGNICSSCIDGYYFGYKYNLCTKIVGCEKTDEEDENICAECDDNFYCLDKKTGKCETNDWIEDEDKKFYYRCNITNEEGNKCEICSYGFDLDENGNCVDMDNCVETNKDNTCKKCKNDDEGSYCLNDIFGCVEIFDEFCLECNDILNLDACTKCIKGYEIDEDGICREVEKQSLK